jgi:uncharacterized membrane protein
MDLLQWLTHTQLGEFCFTVLVSMLPVVELRGGIPFGVAAGLSMPVAFLAAFIGNMIPVPFLILFTRRILGFLRQHVPVFRGFVDWLGRRAEKNTELVLKYRFWGLFVLVAIPLPGTGAWTGSLVAAVLDMRLSRAVPAITAGVLTAGAIITLLTHSVTGL